MAYNRNTDFLENFGDMSTTYGVGMFDTSADTGFDRSGGADRNRTGYKSSFNQVVNGGAQVNPDVEARQQRIVKLQQEMNTEKPTEKLTTGQTAHAAVHGSPETILRAETAKVDRRAELGRLVAENAEEMGPAPAPAQPQQKGAAMDTIIDEVKTSPLQTAAAVMVGGGITAVTGSIELGGMATKGMMALNAGTSAINIGSAVIGSGEDAGDTDTDSFNFDTPAIDLGALTIDSMFLRDKEQKITLFAGMGMEDALLHLGEDAWQIKERLQNVADYERLFGEGLQNRGIMIENPSLSGQQGPAAVA